MNKTNQLICAHSALIPMVGIGAGWFFIPGWFPPVEPGLDAGAVQNMYLEDTMRIRIGASIAAFASVFWWSFSAAIAGQMRRMEGTSDPILSRLQMAAASGTVMVILFSSYFILATAYRAEIDADTIQKLHDLAWIMFIAAYPPGFIQNLSIGLCILTNKSDQHPYPRWLGFANIWFAILTLPGILIPFFHDGPFAWNGLIGFWLVALFFFLWILVNWWFTVAAIKNQGL